MPRYTVYFAREIPPVKWPPARPKVFVAGDYLSVGTFDAPSVGAVYNLLQDPEDEHFREFCAGAGVHTTTCMGDVVRDEGGTVGMCPFEGWYQMELEDPRPDAQDNT